MLRFSLAILLATAPTLYAADPNTACRVARETISELAAALSDVVRMVASADGAAHIGEVSARNTPSQDAMKLHAEIMSRLSDDVSDIAAPVASSIGPKIAALNDACR